MSSTLRFGPFELDPVRRTLSRDGVPISLRPKATTLLCELASRPERVVSKSELLETLWPDGSGNEANLTVTVAAVRKALGEEPGSPRYLITVPREGYRFIGEIRAGEDSGSRTIVPRSLAVLPIEILPPTGPGGRGCLQAGNQDLPDRIREEIAHHLLPLESVHFRTLVAEDLVDLPLHELPQEFDVDSLLVGTLEQGLASVHLDLKMLDRNLNDLWHSRMAHSAQELHTLPLRAARTAVAHLNPDHGRRPSGRRLLTNDTSPAWRAFLQGRFHYRGGEGMGALQQAAISFQRAIEMDPSLAAAHAGLAESLMLLRTAALIDPEESRRKIQAAAASAMEADPLLAESHLAMAGVRMIFDHDWDAGREHLLSALEFGPEDPWVHARYAIFLSWRRQFEAALDSVRRAQSLDPFSMRLTAESAKIHYFAGQAEVALSILESATAHKVDFVLGWLIRTWIHLGQGDGEAALTALESLRDQIEHTALWDAFFGTAHAVNGRPEPALEALARLRERRERGDYVPAQFDGMILLSLGDFEGATQAVLRSAEERYGEFGLVEADPLWAQLRVWPGYDAIRTRHFSPGTGSGSAAAGG
jgi:DNA-binding winged helix-turn-helix (wHTH) protein/Tfp pilus assembly protein PilF